MMPPSDLAVHLPDSNLLGDVTELESALGPPGQLPRLGRSLAFRHSRPVHDLPSLRAFLKDYRRNLLLPLELPAIRRAFDHAAAYEIRELLAFDRQLTRHPLPAGFAFASQAVGRRYLRRLRPLRDVRWIRRYLDAVQHRQAQGWHTLVYGAVLTIYSIPLRQGLVSFAGQTLQGFLDSAAVDLNLPREGRAELARELWLGIPNVVNQVLASAPAPRLLPT